VEPLCRGPAALCGVACRRTFDTCACLRCGSLVVALVEQYMLAVDQQLNHDASRRLHVVTGIDMDVNNHAMALQMQSCSPARHERCGAGTGHAILYLPQWPRLLE
jgi:hypothetical protein